jgi:hypothetical protein
VFGAAVIAQPLGGCGVSVVERERERERERETETKEITSNSRRQVICQISKGSYLESSDDAAM